MKTSDGSISYLIVEFPANKMTGEGFAELLDLVDRGVIRSSTSSRAARMARSSRSSWATSLDGDFDVAVFEGASSGLLDHSDLDDAEQANAPGSSAGILI